MTTSQLIKGLESADSRGFLSLIFNRLSEVSQKAVVVKIAAKTGETVGNSNLAIATWLYNKFQGNPFGFPQSINVIRHVQDDNRTWCIATNRWSKEKFMQLFLLLGFDIDDSKDFLVNLGYELEQAFDFKHYEELIYHFCIRQLQHMNPLERLSKAKELIDEYTLIVDGAKNPGGEDSNKAINQETIDRGFTDVYIEENGLGHEESEQELHHAMQNNAAFFHLCNNTAWINLMRLLLVPKSYDAIKEGSGLQYLRTNNNSGNIQPFISDDKRSIRVVPLDSGEDHIDRSKLVDSLLLANPMYDEIIEAESDEPTGTAYKNFSEHINAQLDQKEPVSRKLFVDCLILTGHIELYEKNADGEEIGINQMLGDNGFQSLDFEQKQDALVYEACMRAKREGRKTAYDYYRDNVERLGKNI